MKKLVFVAMPFGKKKSINGKYSIDFDAIYYDAIKPSVEKTSLICLREDSELNGGIIHNTMFEKLVISDIVIVDLSNENPNVFYELGIRHCAKEHTTILICNEESGKKIPFDIKPLRIILYKLTKGVLKSNEQKKLQEKITDRINLLLTQKPEKDSPLYYALPNYPKLNKSSAQCFKEFFEKNAEFQEKILETKTIDNLKLLEKQIPEILGTDYDMYHIIRLFVEQYRKIEAYHNIISLLKIYTKKLHVNHEYLHQQYALALNRVGEKDNAIKILKDLLLNCGKSPETLGILGRIYKDLYMEKKTFVYLEKAIETYKEGFDLDIRNYYPGINLATLLFLKNDQKSILYMNNILSIILYELNIQNKDKNFWEHATLLEAYTLQENWRISKQKTDEIKFMRPKPSNFELKSLINNMSIILVKRTTLKKDSFQLNKNIQILKKLIVE